jgi:hypothetical protein
VRAAIDLDRGRAHPLGGGALGVRLMAWSLLATMNQLGTFFQPGSHGQRLAERDVGGRLLAGRQDGCFACWQVGGEDAVELAGLDAEPRVRPACLRVG